MTSILKTYPLRLQSQLYGSICNLYIPIFLRESIYGLWCTVFNVIKDDMIYDLKEYETFSDFFSRPIRLKDGIRPIAKGDLVSPVDGVITKFGQVDINGHISQIKDITYSIDEFLGEKPKKIYKNTNLYYCVLYLAPGDYHRIHSATKFDISKRIHISGEMFPVHPIMYNIIPGLLAKNERVILSGKWKYGYFSLSPVAAYNVGGMKLHNLDDELFTDKQDFRTKDSKTQKYKYIYDEKIYNQLKNVKKGDELARFEVGSTVVLIFESKNCKWLPKEGQYIKVGQKLANI